MNVEKTGEEKRRKEEKKRRNKIYKARCIELF